MLLLRIALLSLWQHRRRTSLLAAALALVTALMVLMLGVAEGMQRSLVAASTTLASGHLNVGGFFKVKVGLASPVVTRARELEALVRREVPELVYLTARGRGFAKLVSDAGSQMLGLSSVDVSKEEGLRRTLKLKAGRLEDLARPNSVLLFEEQAAALEVRVGDVVTASAPTMRGANNTVDLTVVAVARTMGMMSSFSCFVDDATLQRLYQLKPDTTGALQLYFASEDLTVVKRVQARLRDALQRAGHQLLEDDPRAFFLKFDSVGREPWTGQKLDVTNWHDEVSFVAWTVDLMNALAFLLAFVLLQMVGVGILIVLWLALRERTREIGALRAIGMQRRAVLLMFLAEGSMLGLLSTLAGCLVGLAVAAVLNAAELPLPIGFQFVLISDRLVVTPTLGWALSAVAFVTAIVTLVALVPAFVAARLSPVSAMGHAS